MIVLDASAAAELLLQFGSAPRIEERIRAELHVAVPHLLDAEVGQVLRRHVRLGAIPGGIASAALFNLATLPFKRFSHVPLMSRAFELREHLTFYDALYVSLAELLGAPLITLDARLANAPGNKARIELIR